MKRLSLVASVALGAALCAAEDSPLTVNTSGKVQALESSLRKQAETGNGTATADLARYPDDYGQIIVRTRTGEVEIHQQYDEWIIIVDGDAKLMTGGAPENPHSIRPGELRASSAPGSKPVTMAKGDVFHLRAGTPHQVIVPAQGFIAYMDIKAAARDKAAK